MGCNLKIMQNPPENIAFDTSDKLASYHGIENNMAIDLRPDETGRRCEGQGLSHK
jgi:hypothetical protein